MSENRFKKGDWTNCRYDICEIIDEDDEVVCIVSLNDADKVIAILEENEQLKSYKLYEDNKRLQSIIADLKKENERLKQRLPYDNIYHRTSKQLENHLKNNGFPVDTVSRSTVGDLSFYHIEFNLSDDEWKYEKTSDLQMRKLLGIRNVGLVDFHKQDGMIHEVILVSVKELDDKYLKDGNLVFE